MKYAKIVANASPLTALSKNALKNIFYSEFTNQSKLYYQFLDILIFIEMTVKYPCWLIGMYYKSDTKRLILSIVIFTYNQILRVKKLLESIKVYIVQ
jgi:hypothetical protein